MPIALSNVLTSVVIIMTNSTELTFACMVMIIDAQLDTTVIVGNDILTLFVTTTIHMLVVSTVTLALP